MCASTSQARLVLPVTDTMGLLERVGAECAGAVQFLPEGAVPGPGDVRTLSDREVDR